MDRGDVRIRIEMVCTAGTGAVCATTKNRRTTPDRLELRTYDKRTRKVEIFRESR